MNKQKFLFIDRDGTLIQEPSDEQIDSIDKFKLEPFVIPSLLQLQKAGYTLIMVSNQDGLGSNHYPQERFDQIQNLLLQILSSQGIQFAAIAICPHWPADQCECRKPKLGLILQYLLSDNFNKAQSFVIGDRQTDLELAEKAGTKGLLYNRQHNSWQNITQQLLTYPRASRMQRTTNETDIAASVNLDCAETIRIQTGNGFFDHMLEQLAKHAGISLELTVNGDLHIDEHHVVEDSGLVIGQLLRQALGDKLGIQRYGFLLPMDESLAQIALDLSGRPYFVFQGKFTRSTIGSFPTELIEHFFRSLADNLLANLHIQVIGKNNHHMAESIFKGVGRALRMAIYRQDYLLPSTKGVL